jgi:hypothetical protein
VGLDSTSKAVSQLETAPLLYHSCHATLGDSDHKTEYAWKLTHERRFASARLQSISKLQPCVYFSTMEAIRTCRVQQHLCCLLLSAHAAFPAKKPFPSLQCRRKSYATASSHPPNGRSLGQLSHVVKPRTPSSDAITIHPSWAPCRRWYTLPINSKQDL